MRHGPMPKSSQKARIRASRSRTTNATWAILPILKVGERASGTGCRAFSSSQRGGVVDDARQDPLAQVENMAADDTLGGVGLARLEGGQNRPVPLGNLLQ